MAGAAVAVAQVGNGNVVANPLVTFVLTSGGSGSNNAILQNTSVGGFNVELSTDVSCDPGVDFQIIGVNPFSLPGMASKSVSLQCAMGSAGMKRCLVHATDSNTGDALVDLLAVCERAQSATLVPSMTTLDFGTVVVGDVATLPLQLQNTGSTSISRLFLQTTDLDGNFQISIPCNPDGPYCDGPIAPVGSGASATALVKCAPRSAGPHSAQLEVATDTSQHSSARVTLTCVGSPATVPVLGVSPPTVVIADPVEVVSATAHAAVHLANLGTGTLQVTDIRTVDVDAGAALDWSVALAGTCTGTPCNLPAGQQVEVGLTFDPSAIATRHASLLVSFHDTIDRTRSIPLAAVGQGATLQLGGPALALDFGTVPVGRTSALDVPLANHGNRDTTAMLSLMPTGPFSLNPATSALVTPMADKIVTATCAPTSAGVANTTITASSGDVVTAAPVTVNATCNGSTSPLYANPTALALGEIRIDDGASGHTIQLLTTGPQLTFTGTPHLDSANTNVTLDAMTSTTTPSTIDVTIDPQAEGDIKTNLVIDDTAGDTLLVPISGKVVTASAAVPDTLDLGTFCVDQPTASSNVALTANGTATIAVATPTVPVASGFELSYTSPTVFPAKLPPGSQVVVAVTPLRQAAATTISDALTWSTDVQGKQTPQTAITARFIDSGGAIAPPILDFGKVPVHLYTDDGQRVMIQNCNTTVLELDPPTIKAPFSIDSPNFPTKLDPNETATFSVGFHPTRIGNFTDTLTISSPQLPPGMPLQVALVGESPMPVGPGSDAGSGAGPPVSTSFYACSCTSASPGGGAPILLALALVMRRRRSRARAPVSGRRRTGSS